MACIKDWVKRVFFITFCIVVIYFAADWVYRESCGMIPPRLSIETATLDYKNGTKIGQWTLGISMRNPNKCNAIHYNVLRALVTLEAAGMCIYTQTEAIKPSIQFPLSTTSAFVNPKGWPMIGNQAAGTSYVNVTLSSAFSFELHPKIKLLFDNSLPCGELFFICRNVPVSFNNRGGIKTGAPIPCKSAPLFYFDGIMVYLGRCAYRFH